MSAVALFDEDTPFELIKVLGPDVLVKGGDYELDDIVGRDLVEGNGREVIVIPFIEGYSTTAVADRLKEAE